MNKEWRVAQVIDFFTVISFWGFVVCFIIFIVKTIRRKPLKPIGIAIAVCIVVFGICVIVSPSPEPREKHQIKQTEQPDTIAEKQTQPSEVPQTEDLTSETERPASEITVEYDNLQKVFLAITTKTTEDDIKSMIKEYGLEFSAEDYNGTPKKTCYKIAFDENVTPQKHADSGDYIEVSFSKEDGSLLVADYFNENSFMDAILYNYGIYWDFREESPNNDYAGYYYHKPGDTEGGITMKYDNGNSKETGYHSVSNAQEALESIQVK